MTVTLISPRGMTYVLDSNDTGTDITLVGTQKIIHVSYPISEIKAGWQLWKAGAYIQVALGFLSADEREFLMTGITSDEWHEMFGDGD